MTSKRSQQQKPPSIEPNTPIPLKNEEVKHMLRQHLGDIPTLVMRDITTGQQQGIRVLVVSIQGLADMTLIAKTVMEPLLSNHRLPLTRTNAARMLAERLVTTGPVNVIHDMHSLIEKLLSGRAVIIPEGSRDAVTCDVSETSRRSIEEPDTEPVARGPREGFIEHLEENLSLLQRRLRTSDLRLENFVMGKYTNTRVVLVYLQDVASDSVVAEVRSRLDRIGDNVDGITLSENITELIEDHPFSLFPTTDASERPERIAAGLLEGRFAVFVEGSPFTLLGPTLFAEFFTTTGDYTDRPIFVAMLRIIRIIALVMTLFLPSLYVAFVSFHQETVPTSLLLSIALGRQGVPFPPIAEALLMEFAFEILREAGLRLPSRLGGAVSIVGVLVVGQAAVAAGVVSPILIIVVGTTAIASFAVPDFHLTNILRFLRFPILLTAGAFGVIGVLISFILLSLHLATLRSFGVPYLAPMAPFRKSGAEKSIVRHHFWKRTNRPPSLDVTNPQRESDKPLMPSPKREDRDDAES